LPSDIVKTTHAGFYCRTACSKIKGDNRFSTKSLRGRMTAEWEGIRRHLGRRKIDTGAKRESS